MLILFLLYIIMMYQSGEGCFSHATLINHHRRVFKSSIKGKDQLWSCDCIVKETLWNRSEKVNHLAYKYWVCTAGSGIIK